MPDRRKTRAVLLFTGCAAPLLIIALLVAAVGWSLVRKAPDEGDSNFAAKGYPETLEELDAWYPEPPEGENAAEVYMKAGERLYLSKSHAREFVPFLGDVEMPELGERIPDAMGNFIDAFIKDEAEAFDLIDQAVQFEGSRYPVKYEVYPDHGNVSYFDMVRSVHRGQRLRVVSAVRRGETNATLDEFETLVRAAESLRNEPTVTAGTVTISLGKRTVESAEFVLNTLELAPDQLNRFDGLLAPLYDRKSTLRSLVGERVILRKKPISDTGFRWIQLLGQRDIAKDTEAYIEVLERGLPEALDAFMELREREYTVFEAFAAIMTPSYSRFVDTHYERLAFVSAARTAIAIERWRAEGNELPDTREQFPDSITNEWPIDPFTGDPLIYTRKDEGYAVYSVGRDLVDDGGLTRDEIRKGSDEQADQPENDDEKAGDVVLRMLK